jgi:hypothetical protein
MITGSRWFRGRRPAMIAGAIGTGVLIGAAAVLAAGASGAFDDGAASPAATASPVTASATVGPSTASTSATGTSTTTSGTVPSSTSAVAAPVSAQVAKAPAKPRRHGPATTITHAPLANLADGTSGVAIRFDGKPAPDTPRPKLSPFVAGRWSNLGPYEVFHPVSTLEPCTSYTMSVPAGTFVLRHRTLGAVHTASFSVACPGITAMQEALARLGFLPYTLHGYVGASSTTALTRKQAARRAYVLPGGKLLPDLAGAPPLEVGTLDPTTTGALEVFEGDHNLPITTTPSRQLWVALLSDETVAQHDQHPYTWVTVSEGVPETLQVHDGSKIALSSPTNTGVPGAATQQGIFPIFERFVATTMIGTNVDGSHYDDPGVPWVNYFNGGDAVHGYIRPGYGYPQSNGCVELPISTAQTVYGMLQLGDLVIVS